MSIRARDFRFHPISRAGEAILGQSQFGQAHDAWGNRFLSWNTIPVRHVLLEEADVSGFPAAAAEAVVNLSEPSDTGRVFPVSPRPQQFNTEHANYYNAMCGLTIFTGDALGTPYNGNAFVCESLTNLVTRRQLQQAGPTFIARRGDNETSREFLASTDNWFHPVNLATGPDGALYIVDFYREFVEHPIYVADEKVRAEVHWRNGAEHGRIWRIRRSDAASLPAERRPQLSRASSNAAAGSPRSSRCVVAQLRLSDCSWSGRIEPSCHNCARCWPSPHRHWLDCMRCTCLTGSTRAKSTLSLEGRSAERTCALDIASLQLALRDPDPNVRQRAVRLAADRLKKIAIVGVPVKPARRTDEN